VTKGVIKDAFMTLIKTHSFNKKRFFEKIVIYNYLIFMKFIDNKQKT